MRRFGPFYIQDFVDSGFDLRRPVFLDGIGELNVPADSLVQDACRGCA